jgi:hypothetical protein
VCSIDRPQGVRIKEVVVRKDHQPQSRRVPRGGPNPRDRRTVVLTVSPSKVGV